MSNNLIFFAVSKRKWHEMNTQGKFSPQGNDQDTEPKKISCATVVSLKDYLDENFRGRKNLLLLVIDKSRVITRVSMDNEDQLAIVDDFINLDAILDKIKISCNDSGTFDIEVASS